MIRFILTLFAVSLVLIFCGEAAVRAGMMDRPSYFYETLALVAVTTGGLYRYLSRAGTPGFFVQLYLLTMVVKFLAYGCYVFIILFLDRPGGASNVVFFLLIYGVFTVLEISFLYRRISEG